MTGRRQWSGGASGCPTPCGAAPSPRHGCRPSARERCSALLDVGGEAIGMTPFKAESDPVELACAISIGGLGVARFPG